MTPTPLRRLLSVTAAMCLAVVLTACGGDDEGGDDRADDTGDTGDDDTSQVQEGVVSSDDLTSALLTTDDLPDGFTEDPDEDDDTEVFEGTCFEDVDDFDSVVGTDPATEENASFTLESDAGQQQVNSEISSYAPDVALADAIDGVAQDLASCTSIDVTDDEGLVYALTLQSSTDLRVSGAEQEVDIILTGTITPPDAAAVPVRFGSILTRVDNTISKVGTTEIGGAEGLVATTPDLGQAQLDRLVDVIG